MRAVKKEQLEFMDWEFGAFFHFGIRTFYEGHKDWDMQEMSLDKFNPTSLDCRQWIRMVKQAGARYAILVCKHHDGFANWPSKYTDYSVAGTPWKDGSGDVVKEFTDACREYGMKIGLYYSPAQFGSDRMNGREYDDYFINQLSELLTNYGKIDYLWFDGNGSEGHEYDTVRIIDEIRKMQPYILIFNMWDPDTRWAGNESGMVSMPNHNITNELDFSVSTDELDTLKAERFLPAECDCRIRLENWFYSDNDLHTLKSVDELLGLYMYSVGRGANLLLNIGPDRRGLLPDEDAARVVEFGKKIKEIFSDPIADIKNAERNENTYSVKLKENTLVNYVVLEEDMSFGEHVEKFSICLYPFSYGKPIKVYESSTIGHKHICKIPTFRTERVDIVIEKETGPHKIKNIELFYNA